MVNYVFTITEKKDEKDRKNYFIYDSFNTCLGCFSNLELAYDIISCYLKHIREIYEGSAFSNTDEQISNIQTVKTSLHFKSLKDIEYTDQLFTSLKESNGINKQTNLMIYKTTNSIFSTKPISLTANFNILFREEDIASIHLKLVSNRLQRNNMTDINSFNMIKKILLQELSEEQIDIHLPFLNINGQIINNENINKKRKII